MRGSIPRYRSLMGEAPSKPANHEVICLHQATHIALKQGDGWKKGLRGSGIMQELRWDVN